MPRPSQRDRILEAYVDVVVTQGPEVVTLEGVARAAEVSKGGLLYHFGSKDALLDGLLEHSRALTEADVAAARASGEGVARYYLRTSVDDPKADASVFRTTVALFKLATTEPRAAEATRECMGAWQEALREEIGDPVLAEMVAAIGDGIYLRAMVGGTFGAGPEAVLTALARARPTEADG